MWLGSDYMKRIILYPLVILFSGFLLLFLLAEYGSSPSKEEFFEIYVASPDESVRVHSFDISGFTDLSMRAHFSASKSFLMGIVKSREMSSVSASESGSEGGNDAMLDWNERPGKTLRFSKKIYTVFNGKKLLSKDLKLIVNDSFTEAFYLSDDF